MQNLKTELNKLLKWHNKSTQDIDYIILNNKLLPLNKFLKAYDVEYNDGYINTDKELNESLKIVGIDFVIYVDNYDGAKSLSYLSIPNESDLDSNDNQLQNKLIVGSIYNDDI